MPRQLSAGRSAARTRNPYRRLLVVGGGVALLGLNTVHHTAKPWFLGAFNDGTTTSWTPVGPDAIARNGMIVGPTGPMPASYQLLGTPAVRFWLYVALALTALAVVTRLGLFSLAAVAALWVGRGAAVTTHATLTGAAAQGRFVELAGFGDYVSRVWVLMALVVILSAQITYANSVERRAAISRGETPEPALVDVLESVAGGITRFGRTSTSNGDRSDDGRTPARQPAPAAANRR